MTFKLLLILSINIIVYSYEVHTVIQNPLTFKLHTSENLQILTEHLHDTVDVRIISNSTKPICKSQINQYDFQVDQKHQIELNEIVDFDPLKPLVVEEQFITFVQTPIGFLVITSESTISLFDHKLDRKFFGKFKINRFGDFPQVIYNNETENVIIFYNEKVKLFPLKQLLEEKLYTQDLSSSLFQYSIKRQKTVSYKQWLLSLVESETIEIYKIFNLMLIQQERFNMKIINRRINDLFVQDDYLFIAEDSNGVIIMKLIIKDDLLILEEHMSKVGLLESAEIIAVYKNILCVVYEQHGFFTFIEYYLDLKRKHWEIINIVYPQVQVNDVIINQDFIILQGIDSHQIIHHSINSDFKYFAQSKPQLLLEQGIRQISFVGKVRQIFGITKNSILKFQYSPIPNHISCFTENYELLDMDIKYELIYNQSTARNFVQQNFMNLTLKIVGIEMFGDQQYYIYVPLIIGILCSILIAIFLICKYYAIEREKSQLVEEIEYEKQKTNSSSEQAETNVSSSSRRIKKQTQSSVIQNPTILTSENAESKTLT